MLYDLLAIFGMTLRVVLVIAIIAWLVYLQTQVNDLRQQLAAERAKSTGRPIDSF